MSLEKIVIEPKESAQACVIWIHGLGDSGAGMAPVIPYLGLDDSLNVRFVLPDAPEQPVTINAGYIMRSWYDIKSERLSDRVDMDGINESEQLILEIIEGQIQSGIPSSKIILAGFSQGGVLSLYTGLRLRHKLAGIIGMSCYLASGEQLPEQLSEANRSTSILQNHGSHDDVVPVSAGRQAYETLKASGYDTEWREYTALHSLLPQQLTEIGRWITERLT
ncbi:alpha/beta hydrolase [Shewanella gelidii]|uniref:Carboxylesterase n=1 Tax=Shewanella gelidii TaxID=1642821 RepID=A0A917JPW1_9GAMM|nr:carboxylesterase [Shewanella gelidii]MCL1099246.1 alpha/beta hydrolase [Shewanella gelidii]GGI76703.1 carboxylesterase [Shewanella gelidii]